ncbi:Cytochrome P450 2C2 [Nymphon striatum]|nr:Cytochrome P450 2C2 [Nymphon striatum]
MDDKLKAALTLILIYSSYAFLSLSLAQSLLAGIVFSLVLWYLDDEHTKNLPPGPPQFPLIGCLISLIFQKLDFIFAQNSHKKYGPIVNASIGKLPMIFVGDYEMAKEVSVHPELQLRPNIGLISEFNKKLGIITADGNLWKHQRRFLLHSLRDSGMGKLRMQEKIQDELDKIMGVLDGSKGEPMYMHSLLEKSTANIIFALAFNKQFDYDDQDFINRITALDNNLKYMAAIAPFSVFRFLKGITALDNNFKYLAAAGPLSVFGFLRPFISGFLKKIYANIELMKIQSQEFIDEHKATLDPNNPRDLLDLYLIEMDRVVEDDKEDAGYHKTFYEEQLKYLIIDIFGAGTETSSTTIRWALLYMVRHPEIQEKVRKEIDEVVGTERYPQMEDKSNLPYTTAALQEAERLGSAIAQSLPRSSENAVKFRNYIIPKRSLVAFSLYTIHRDPKLWDDPDSFNPSRFIDAEGKVFRPPYLMPFGSGKRNCAGESLAKMEIFLFFATLLQNFVFKAPDKNSLPPLTSPKGVIRVPSPYQVKCLRRQR